MASQLPVFLSVVRTSLVAEGRTIVYFDFGEIKGGKTL
jgi:hypothetical protein